VASGIEPVGTFRKDHYLPQYNETSEDPKHGGRFHVVGVAAAGGDVSKILLDGVDTGTLGAANPPSKPPFEWVHVWPRKGLKAGDPIWVTFHSRDAKWDSAASVPVTVETTEGKALEGVIPVAPARVAITYVTTTQDRSTVVIHLKNVDKVPHTIARVVVDGLDVSAADVACIPKSLLAPGETLLVTAPTCEPSVPGAARTVRVDLSDGPPTVAGLRIAKPFFPVESWNNSDECAFPLGKSDVFAAYQAAGVDTSYFSPDNCGKCGCDPSAVLDEYPKVPGAYTLATSGILQLPKIGDTSKILAVSTGDESDGEVYEKDGSPRPFFKAKQSLEVWSKYPELLTFNGGKTNENNGTFAGSADIQGMDLYVAACAPYILPFPAFPPVRNAYDYLRNTRENHAPLPTWLYSQGLSPAWGEKQPDPQEILVQGFSVIAAGAKGFMWFQTNQKEAKKRPDRWDAIVAVNRMVRGVRELLREGDLTGLATAPPEALVEAIRSREAIVVPVIDLKTTDGPDWPSCGLASTVPSLLKHWIFASISPEVTVTVPDDIAVEDVFEVKPGSVVDAPSKASGRALSLGPVALSNATPVRLFVLAARKDLRAEVQAAMQFLARAREIVREAATCGSYLSRGPGGGPLRSRRSVGKPGSTTFSLEMPPNRPLAFAAAVGAMALP
jgi:hypothetical protein